MLNVVFMDTIGWDYHVGTPLERPLGGSQSALCYLATELARRGHQVTLLNHAQESRVVNGVQCRGYRHVPVEFFQQPFDAFILLNAPADACLNMRNHLRPGTPLILWTQHAIDQPAMQPLLRPEVRNGWSAIVCVSDWHRRTMISHFGLDPNRVCILRNAVTPTFENLFADADALARAKSGPPVLAYTSTPFRGLELLLSIFPEVHAEFPDARLAVYSSMKVYNLEADKDDFAPLYERCRQMPGVDYVGSLPQVRLAEALRKATIFSYPNVFPETSCIAVMEALAAGLAVVTTDLGALPETTMGRARLVPPPQTTMGFAQLVPSPEMPGGPADFSRQFLAQLREVLRFRQEDPHAFAAQRFEQVQAIRESCTWARRAVEWELAIQGWRQKQTEQTEMSLEQAQQLARTHLQAGRLDKAEAVCRLILQSVPGDAETHRILGLVVHAAGRSEAAVASLRQAIALNPNVAEYHDNLAAILSAMGRTAEAEAAGRQALALKPDSAIAQFNFGRNLHTQGRLEEAVAAYRQALQMQPDLLEAESGIGHALQMLGRLDEAIQSFQRVLDRNPRHVEAVYNLGCVLQKLGRLEEAREAFERALALQPDFPEAENNLGNTLQGLGRTEESVPAYLRALKSRPNFTEAENNLGNAYQILGRLEEAAAAFRRALALRPGMAEVENNLGYVLLSQGRLEEALTQYRRALELRPDFSLAHSNALLGEQYRPGVTLAGLARAHAEWDERHGLPLRKTWRPFANDRDPDRPLRIGFVSSDLAIHPVGFFIVRFLEGLDRSQCETFAFSDRGKPDHMSERIRQAVTAWYDTHRYGDAELAERIRAERIDLLFDLAGHTGGNRLLTFARKPAPVQLTWMGYVGTTGLSAIDYLVADRYHVPEGAEVHYREKVIRLPDGYVCYDPPAEAPEVGPLPALENGHVTFCSFSNPCKVSVPVVAMWSEILERVPGSRLILQYGGFADPTNRRRFSELFTASGIDLDRVELRGKVPLAEILAEYNRVDIALDPHPYSGGLTTCEALWMGVPVITWPGETFASRHSFSYLSNVGLT